MTGLSAGWVCYLWAHKAGKGKAGVGIKKTQIPQNVMMQFRCSDGLQPHSSQPKHGCYLEREETTLWPRRAQVEDGLGWKGP